jgi:hypothetical protein
MIPGRPPLPPGATARPSRRAAWSCVRYGDREVLHGIDLVVPHGMVVGFLGPNGAGKTTTVEILEGYRRRTAGHASVPGMDPASGGRELRERIGIVLQETGHNPDLTVRQFAGYYGRPRPVDEVVGLVGLEEAATVTSGTVTPRPRHHPLRGPGYVKRLGPGIVTGAADADPSGIGTYSQVGANFGFGCPAPRWRPCYGDNPGAARGQLPRCPGPCPPRVPPDRGLRVPGRLPHRRAGVIGRLGGLAVPAPP